VGLNLSCPFPFFFFSLINLLVAIFHSLSVPCGPRSCGYCGALNRALPIVAVWGIDVINVHIKIKKNVKNVKTWKKYF